MKKPTALYGATLETSIACQLAPTLLPYSLALGSLYSFLRNNDLNITFCELNFTSETRSA
jgi:hypothetical protein